MRARLPFLALTAALISCVATVGAVYEAPVALLIVENDRLEDAHIYLQRTDGRRDRHLGIARGTRVDTLLLRYSDITPGTEVGFVAMSFLTGATDQSNRVIGALGTVYRWTIGPARGQQSNLWRSSTE